MYLFRGCCVFPGRPEVRVQRLLSAVRYKPNQFISFNVADPILTFEVKTVKLKDVSKTKDQGHLTLAEKNKYTQKVEYMY